MLEPHILKDVQRLYTRGKTEDCIDYLMTHAAKDVRSFDLLDLKRRMHGLQQKIDRGLINNTDANVEQNQINNSLLNVIKALEKGDAPAGTKAAAGNRLPLYLGIASGVILIAVYLASLIGQGTKTDTGSSTPDTEQATSSTTDPSTPDTTVAPDCGANGELVDGKCKCDEGYGGDLCEYRVAPTKHLIFDDLATYVIESVDIGETIDVNGSKHDMSTFFSLSPENNPSKYNGNIFELQASPENDCYYIKFAYTTEGLIVANDNYQSLGHSYYRESTNMCFRFLAVGDERHFSIQPKSNPDLYLRSYGEDGQLRFTQEYTSRETLFKLKKRSANSF